MYDVTEENCEVERAYSEETDGLVGSLGKPITGDIGDIEQPEYARIINEGEIRDLQELEPIQVVQRHPGNNALERESQAGLTSDRVVVSFPRII